jgi:ABC-type transport system involved in multi-copper enzyme maturation permease subunit
VLPSGRLTVLVSKWIGSVVRVRWPLAATILPLTFGLMIGAFHWALIAVLALAVTVQLVFAASLGMCCSVLFSSTARATLAAVVVIVLSGLLSASRVYPHLGKLGGSTAQQAAETLSYRLSPLAIWQNLLSRPTSTQHGVGLEFALQGIAFTACAAAILAGLAMVLFVRRARA